MKMTYKSYVWDFFFLTLWLICCAFSYVCKHINLTIIICLTFFLFKTSDSYVTQFHMFAKHMKMTIIICLRFFLFKTCDSYVTQFHMFAKHMKMTIIICLRFFLFKTCDSYVTQFHMFAKHMKMTIIICFSRVGDSYVCSIFHMCSGWHPKLQQPTSLEFRRTMNCGDTLRTITWI